MKGLHFGKHDPDRVGRILGRSPPLLQEALVPRKLNSGTISFASGRDVCSIKKHFPLLLQPKARLLHQYQTLCPSCPNPATPHDPGDLGFGAGCRGEREDPGISLTHTQAGCTPGLGACPVSTGLAGCKHPSLVPRSVAALDKRTPTLSTRKPRFPAAGGIRLQQGRNLQWLS